MVKKPKKTQSKSQLYPSHQGVALNGSSAELRIFRQSFLDSSDAIMITDKDGIIIDVNPAFCQIYGFSRDEAVGQTPRLLRHPTSNPELYRKMWADILNPEIGFWKGEILNRSKDGRTVPVMLSITPIRDPKGRTTHYMGLAIDISDQRELEAKMERLRREYGAFLRHELRNLLASIIGYHELALTLAEPAPPRLKKYLEGARDTTLSTLNIIEMLRDLEHYEMGKIELDRERTSLRELVERSIEHLKPLAQEAKIRIVIDEETKGEVVSVDKARMQSVFVNLLKNAIEHIAGIPGEVVRVRIYKERGEPAVAVNNGGPTVPPERLTTFFDRFNTTKKNIGGTGLGTTFAELITVAHGGNIWVTSSAEEGTTVTVRLPQVK